MCNIGSVHFCIFQRSGSVAIVYCAFMSDTYIGTQPPVDKPSFIIHSK